MSQATFLIGCFMLCLLSICLIAFMFWDMSRGGYYVYDKKKKDLVKVYPKRNKKSTSLKHIKGDML